MCKVFRLKVEGIGSKVLDEVKDLGFDNMAQN